MKSHPDAAQPLEIELKLYLPSTNPRELAKRLASTPVLARRKAVRQSLYNVYFDTPDQKLRQQRIALRLRRVGGSIRPQWLQTLKTGVNDESALSRRGEWEIAVQGEALDQDALKLTPWVDIDPDGNLFNGLSPRFVTAFERTTWLVPRPDGSVVEVALDIGHIEANSKIAPICELEFELKAGLPSALFEVAREIAHTVAVLPANESKAQRGFLLAQDGLDQPKRAQTPKLNLHMAKPELAQCLLREMFAQFTMNLNALRSSGDPEIVHQARIGWRRFKCGLHLFRNIPGVTEAPARLDLKPLLSCLGTLRNLDVALTETLPHLSDHYCVGNTQRAESWQAVMTELTQAAVIGRKAVRYALQEPSVGANLLLISEWLENLASPNTGAEQKARLRPWAKRRVLRLHQRLELAQQAPNTPENQHRVRILAKRLRYGVEALRDLLPKWFEVFCYEQAVSLQTSLGATRDIAQASALIATLEAEPAITAFLRGVAAGLDVMKSSPH
jgi:inorganic triphosphatase YgiF